MSDGELPLDPTLTGEGPGPAFTLEGGPFDGVEVRAQKYVGSIVLLNDWRDQTGHVYQLDPSDWLVAGSAAAGTREYLKLVYRGSGPRA